MGAKPDSHYDLLGYNFFIPSYQRGYRWTAQQVTELLSDIWNFKENPPKQEEGREKPFYCLQPIVVKVHFESGEKYWEVIDGQQRLTTILISLYYFNQTEFKIPKQLFDLNFQTRTNSKFFLSKIEDKSFALKNIDYFHFNKAYESISNWFIKKEKENSAIKGDFYSVLINQTKVIWYEVNDGADAIDIFTRLNIGKIPLTNAELIKALFLKNSNFLNESDDKIRLKQLQIATEWDKIENTLQDDSFWYFISNNSSKYATRIEYIFDLMKVKNDGDEHYFTFYKFNEDFEKRKLDNGNPDIDNIWLSIKKYFLTFEAWYRNRELYHLVGFLISTGKGIKDLKDKSETSTKTAFKFYLKEEIKKKVVCQIDELGYGNPMVKTILLLFNIQTILSNEKSNIRFPFNCFKEEKWDIEHVRSQTDKTIIGNTRKDWARDILEYFTGKKESEKQTQIIESLSEVEKRIPYALLQIISAEKINDAEFDSLYIELCQRFNEDNEPENITISNLALLDASTNRSYKNAFFPIKRKIIIENDMQGTFVPICTKNVFLKSYSKKLDKIMYWNKNDAEDYLTAIKEILSIYLPLQMK